MQQFQQAGQTSVHPVAPAPANLVLHPRQRRGETSVVKRLQEIVDRLDLERPQRVLVVGRDKHHGGPLLRSQFTQGVKTAATRHLHIEKREVRPFAPHQSRRLGGGRRFTHDFDLRLTFEQQADTPPRRRLVVHNDGPQPI